MASIDSTVVNVTTVSIGESFGSTTAMLTWIVDAYVLTYASLLLLGGSLATSFGSRRLYMLGMGVFSQRPWDVRWHLRRYFSSAPVQYRASVRPCSCPAHCHC